MSEFNNELYLASRKNSNTVAVCPITTAGASSIYETSLTGGDAGISATTYDGKLYLAYKNTANDDLIMAETTGGITFAIHEYSNMQINGSQNIAPPTTVFNGLFYLVMTANNSGHDMYLTQN